MDHQFLLRSPRAMSAGPRGSVRPMFGASGVGCPCIGTAPGAGPEGDMYASPRGTGTAALGPRGWLAIVLASRLLNTDVPVREPDRPCSPM
jgi:hypothetical protein